MTLICLRPFTLISMLLISLSTISQNLKAQEKDPVLFSVDGKPVRTSEFEYIYTKNNAQDADYSRESLQEYLDLYIKFKLKVQAAYDQDYDTIPGLKAELAGYRNQLASSYLLDKEVKNRLLEEAYKRKEKDINISHILIELDNRSTREDSVKAYEKALLAREKIVDKGVPFATVAAEFSDDRTKEYNGGNLGYVTAILPRGYYGIENAIYEMKPGEVSQPILSAKGYHILKVNDIRPARGEMEIAHILARKTKEDESGKAAEAKIRRFYRELENGELFEDIARNYSDDKATGQRGGYIGYIRIGMYEETFEDTAYALSKDGEYSEPIESSIGWHIIKRVSKKERLPFQLARRGLESDLRNTERLVMARKSLIRKIKKDANYTFFENAFREMASKVDTTFFDFSWRVPSDIDNDALFRLGKDTKYTTNDFLEYTRQQKRERIQMQGRKTVYKALKAIFIDFVDKRCIEFEESRLEEKYPDFKALMREYEEGILLFEITRDKVWDKASADTVGLQQFYMNHRDGYKWPERMLVKVVYIDSTTKDQAKEIYSLSERKGLEKVERKYNKDREMVSVVDEKWEKGKNELSGTVWEADEMGPLVYDETTKDSRFFKLIEKLPIEYKSLEEARGYVIADYQDHLEKEWIAQLKDKYSVEINQEVFNSLIRE